MIRSAPSAPPIGARRTLADREVRGATSDVDVTRTAVPVFADSRPWRDDYLAALGDAHVEWKESIAAGEYSVSKYRVTGRHIAPLLGVAPTGRAVSFDMYSARATNGDGSEDVWATFDSRSLLHQLREPDAG